MALPAAWTKHPSTWPTENPGHSNLGLWACLIKSRDVLDGLGHSDLFPQPLDKHHESLPPIRGNTSSPGSFFVSRCAATPEHAGVRHWLGARQPEPGSGHSTELPAEALRGRLLITQPPDVTLNGHPARLSPGARIRGHNNLLLLSGSLAGKEQLVNYTRESNGLIHEIWILSEAEAQVPRNGLPLIGTLIPGTRTETVKVDDGRTPFDQLPVFKP